MMNDGAIIGAVLALGAFVIALLTLVISGTRRNYETFATKGEINQVLGQQTVDKAEILGQMTQMEGRIRESLGDVSERLRGIENRMMNGRRD